MRCLSSSVARSISALVLLSAGACATAGGPSTSPAKRSNSAASRNAETLRYWRQLQDSVTAQSIADEQGPRVSIRAEFTAYADSRRVEAWFNVQDDAYVFVAHIDANGVVKVLFPETPDDEGFVRGGKSYHTPPVFAGFESDYLYRRANHYSQIATSRGRLDSYDYGTGYMFIVASWRPMRFDRVSENGKWSTFELSDEEMLEDPRPAVGELATILAGDNREAYSVEFAKYYRTNLSQSGYASSSFSSLQCAFGYNSFANDYSWLRGSYIPVYGYNPFGYSPFGYSTIGLGSGCGGGYYGGGYYGGYLAYYPYRPSQQPPPINNPLVRPSPRFPLTLPRTPVTGGRLPDGTSPKPVGTPEAPSIQPAPRLRATDELLTPRDAPTSNAYRQRGLITDDDGTSPSTTAPRIAGEAQRPSIVDMVGRRRQDVGGQGLNDRTGRYGQPRNGRESIEVPRGSYHPRNDGSSYPSAGVSAPRGGEARQFNPSYGSPRSEPSGHHPSSGGGGETHSTPAPSAPAHIERPSAPPVTTPRAEPASRPEPSKPKP